MGAQRRRFHGKSISGLIYDEAYKKTFTDWRTLYDQQAQQLDSMPRMGQPSQQVDAMRYAMEAQRARANQQLDKQAMAVPGQWYTGTGTSSTSSTSSIGGTWDRGGDMSISRQDAIRLNNVYWDREYSLKYGKSVWRLNHRLIHEHLTKLGRSIPAHPDYDRLRDDHDYFDRIFGPGAYKAYLNGPLSYEAYGEGHLKQRPKPTVKPKPKSRLVPWTVRSFVVEGGKTVAQQLEKNRSDSMVKASKKFYVGYKETLLEALQRDFDIWTTGISIRSDKPGEFTMQSKGLFIANTGIIGTTFT